MPYYPMQENQSRAIIGQGIRRAGASMGEGFEALDEEQKRLLLGKLGLAGPFDTVTRLRSQAREGLAGAIGLRPPTLAAPTGGALGGQAGLAVGGGSAAKSAAQGALKARARSMAKNAARKAIGAL